MISRTSVVAFFCILTLTACNRNSAPKASVHEIAGSSAERVAAVSAMLKKHKSPPTAILDAHFVEEQVGDDRLGPSDFQTFCFVEVAPQNVAQWTQLLSPLAAKAEYDAPEHSRDWWIVRDAFASLQFYQSDALTGRVHGWIGVSQETGRIYIYTFTM